MAKFAEGMGEKAEEVKKLFESGCFNKPFVILTSMYVNDKQNFLMGEK